MISTSIVKRMEIGPEFDLDFQSELHQAISHFLSTRFWLNFDVDTRKLQTLELIIKSRHSESKVCCVWCIQYEPGNNICTIDGVTCYCCHSWSGPRAVGSRAHVTARIHYLLNGRYPRYWQICSIAGSSIQSRMIVRARMAHGSTRHYCWITFQYQIME